MSKLDYYEVLSVTRTVSDSELKVCYRRLAMKYHPDRNNDVADAEHKFKEIKEAYEVLKDPQKRALYDQYGHAGLERSAGGTQRGGEGFGDIFSDIFGDIFGGGGGRQQGVYRGADLAYQMSISLEESAFGTNRELTIPRKIQCQECHGSGVASGHSPVTCTQCDGSGQVRIQQGFFSISQTCPTCNGRGQEIKNPCSKCHGHGVVNESKTLSVKIPVGVDNGDRIRLQGEGEAGENGGPAGDLYIQIQLKEHEIFQRDGINLHCEVPISFVTAALGGKIKVPSLKNSQDLDISPETQTSKTFRLRGKGVKSARSNNIGDLFCTVRVETPVKLSKKQKDIMREFDESMNEKPGRHSPQSSSWLDKVKSFVDGSSARNK